MSPAHFVQRVPCPLPSCSFCALLRVLCVSELVSPRAKRRRRWLSCARAPVRPAPTAMDGRPLHGVPSMLPKAMQRTALNRKQANKSQGASGGSSISAAMRGARRAAQNPPTSGAAHARRITASAPLNSVTVPDGYVLSRARARHAQRRIGLCPRRERARCGNESVWMHINAMWGRASGAGDGAPQVPARNRMRRLPGGQSAVCPAYQETRLCFPTPVVPLCHSLESMAVVEPG
jgi:hypothetical protein